MAFDDALQPLLARLRAGYASSPLPDFLSWWGGQLRACLPEPWRATFEDHVETLLLDRGSDGLDVYYASRPGQPPVTRIDAALSSAEQRLALNEARAALGDPRVRIYLCLPRGKVLLRQLQLPVAAERNLRQVLGFEMDRQTPFKMDQVYLDQRIEARDADKKTLTVAMAVVPRAVLDAEAGKLAEMDLPLDGIDAWADAPGSARLGFNFLPVGQRVSRHNKRLWLNIGLATAALCLLWVAMSTWVGNREQALEAMRAEVSELQKQAKQVSVLRQGLSDSINGASFLMRKKIETPLRMQLLQDVTHALDDQTYLQRLNLDSNDRLSLQGMSEHAAALLVEVAAIPRLKDASFQGVIQPDARTGKERFTILATVATNSEAQERIKAAAEKQPAKPEAGSHKKEGPDAPADSTG